MSAEELKKLGYKPGNIIISPDFPNTPLRIGYGIVFSEYQQSFVVGCMDKDNEYYTAVPIYNKTKGIVAKLIRTSHPEGYDD